MLYLPAFGYGIQTDEESFDSSISDAEDELPIENLNTIEKPLGGNWNDRFQELLEASRKASIGNQMIDIYRSMSSIVRDFNHVASHYGTIIISELFLPIEQKTVPPWDVGGIAGGIKYKAQGIIFKFAKDVPLKMGDWLYGTPDEPNDENAMKAAGNELKALTSLHLRGSSRGYPSLSCP